MGIHSQAWCWHHAIAPPSASPAKKLAAAQASQQLRYGSSATVQVHQGLPVYSANAAAAARASDSVAQALTGQFDAAQPKKKRPFAELKTFQSIEQLYKIATHGDALSNTPSFAEMQNVTQIGGNTCANGSMSSRHFLVPVGLLKLRGFCQQASA